MYRARDLWGWLSKFRRRGGLVPIVLVCVACAEGRPCGPDAVEDECDTSAIEAAETDVTADTTAPVLTVDTTGFLVAAEDVFYARDAAPIFVGTVTDASPVTMQAVVDGNPIAVAVSGGAWTFQLPPGPHNAISQVRITATDAAGNSRLVIRIVWRDLNPPRLGFLPYFTRDEANEQVYFAPDQTVTHWHGGEGVPLAVWPACTPITKFSHLLGATAPEYVIEDHGWNPLRYHLTVDDRPAAIDPQAVQYRVGRRSGSQTSWVLDWTWAGAGDWISTLEAWFHIPLLAEKIPGLSTIEGIYEVEFRASDRLGQTATTQQCFDLKLRAPPLEVEAHSGTRQTKHHTYALDSLSLAPGAAFDQIAARLLNDDATGASLIDQDVKNRTTSPIYLTVTVTPPTGVTAAQSFSLGNAVTDVTVVTPDTCGPECEVEPVRQPKHVSAVVQTPVASPVFPVKVFEIYNNTPVNEIPCVAPCPPSGQVFKFALPPRASGNQPPRVFRVMTMIGQVPALWPQNAARPASAPFVDDTLAWWYVSSSSPNISRITGLVDRSYDPERIGCVKYALYPPETCARTGTVVPYRALRSAALTFSSPTQTVYGTSPAAAVAPRPVGTLRSRAAIAENNWSTTEEAGLP